MAKRVVKQLIDDIDGTVVDASAGESIEFAVQGAHYRIDLTNENAAKFHEALAVYVEHASPVEAPRPDVIRSPRRREARVDPMQTQAMRAWLRQRGHEVPERGRIPQELQDEYHAGRDQRPRA